MIFAKQISLFYWFLFFLFFLIKSEYVFFTVQLLLLIRCLIFIFQEVPYEAGSVCILYAENGLQFSAS